MVLCAGHLPRIPYSFSFPLVFTSQTDKAWPRLKTKIPVPNKAFPRKALCRRATEVSPMRRGKLFTGELRQPTIAVDRGLRLPKRPVLGAGFARSRLQL